MPSWEESSAALHSHKQWRLPWGSGVPFPEPLRSGGSDSVVSLLKGIRVRTDTRTHIFYMRLNSILVFILLTWKTCRSRGKKIMCQIPDAFFLLFSVHRILFGFWASVSEFLIFPSSHGASLSLCCTLACLSISDSQIEHNPLAAVKVCSSLPIQLPTE